MNRLKIIITLALLFQISLSATQLDIENSLTLDFAPNKSLIFYISIENFPINVSEGSILVTSSLPQLKDLIEIKSNFVDEITEESPQYSNSLVVDDKNKLNEIIFHFPKDEKRKKYFLFSIENKGEEELELTLTPLKFPQEFIVKSDETKKLEFAYTSNVPIYYQLNIEFTGDFINIILYCEEI